MMLGKDEYVLDSISRSEDTVDYRIHAEEYVVNVQLKRDAHTSLRTVSFSDQVFDFTDLKERT